MTTIYTYDSQGIYSGAVECDPLKAVPPGLLVAPPALTGTQVAQVQGDSWVVLPEYPVPPVQPPMVPSAVTMRQARLALLGAGLLASVDAAIDGLPSPQKEAARIEWEYATEVQRSSGLVPMMVVALGLDDAALDALFIEAAAL